MASTEKVKIAGGSGYVIRLSPSEDSTRPRIRLGKVTKKQADTARTHIEELIASRRTGSTMPPATQQWVASADRNTRSRLEKLGLLESSTNDGVDLTVGVWTAEYIHKRTDIKPRTRENMTQARTFLMEFLDADLALTSFTQGHAEDFRRFLLAKGQAEATVRRRCKRARQFFAAAIKHGHLTANPFNGIPTGNVANKERRVQVDRVTIATVIAACPDDQWRLIFALARYGGLRIPSEIQGLRWDNIDRARRRFTVHSPKTEHIDGMKYREVPLFPELAPYFDEWLKQRRATEPLVFPTLVKRSNLREHALRIIRKAGIQPWTRVFQNLRASRETELVKSFPIHVVAKWLGNSPETAKKHYLSVEDSDFEMAAAGRSALSWDVYGTDLGQTMAVSGSQASTRENEDSLEMVEVEGVDSECQPEAICDKSQLAPPRGIEPLFPG